MATLRTVICPKELVFPAEYKRIEGENETVIYILPVTCEMNGFKKYSFGRYFNKDFTISEPKTIGLTETTITRPVNYKGYIYVPEGIDSNKKLFIMGSFLDLIFEDLFSLLGINELIDKDLDIATLEKSSFRSGTVKLIGHKYNKGGTVSFYVRKTDGSSFEDDDPDFVSCDELDKESLEIRLTVSGKQEIYHVYSSGKITRNGVKDTEEDTFLHFYTVYNIIQERISQSIVSNQE